jgi:hypothetical protein
MKPGLAAVLAVALALPGGLGSQLGCSHPTPREPVDPVVDPDERPPLPPASGTSIGFLVDDVAELKLSDDQLGKLRAINDELATQLAIDDGDMKPEPVQPAKKDDNKGRGLGFRAGGSQEGFGGYTGGFPNAPRTAGQTGTEDQGGSRQYVIPASTVNKVYQARARHTLAAIKRALGLLDASQQTIAKRVLVDHGVNLDTGEVQGGDPGEKKLEDPKPGQPLPREPN